MNRNVTPLVVGGSDMRGTAKELRDGVMDLVFFAKTALPVENKGTARWLAKTMALKSAR